MFLDDELKEGLRSLKERDGIPEAEAVRRAVADYLRTRGIAIEAKKTAPRRAATRRKA